MKRGCCPVVLFLLGSLVLDIAFVFDVADPVLAAVQKGHWFRMSPALSKVFPEPIELKVGWYCTWTSRLGMFVLQLRSVIA